MSLEFLTFDSETDGVDTANCHIVTAFLGLMDETGTFGQTYHPLINTRHDIPLGAIAVHGITNERMIAEGIDPREALSMIRYIINTECIQQGKPLVAFNAPFDLTLLQAELVRHGLEPLDIAAITVLDPMVIDKHLTPIRRGKSRLTDIAPLYGVPVETNAHDAGADCLMTGRVLLAQLQKPNLAKFVSARHTGLDIAAGLRELHEAQIGWKATQAASLQAYFHSPKGGSKTDVVIDGGWPLQLGTGR